MTDASTLATLNATTSLSPERRILLSAVVEKQRREPFRFKVSKLHEATPAPTPAVVYQPIDVDETLHSAAAMAVFAAKPNTCRFPVGPSKAEFAYCGAPATVVAAGRLTYCSACAQRMYAPKAVPVSHRLAVRSSAQRRFIGK